MPNLKRLIDVIDTRLILTIYREGFLMVVILTKTEVRLLLEMKEIIGIIEEAFVELANKTTVHPLRQSIAPEKHNGTVLFMPSYLSGMESLAIKIVSVYPDNPTLYEMPTVSALVVLIDPKTGAPLAVMDGGYLTAIRTGAVSGVATKHLARKDSKIAAIIGAGVQARTQLQALCAVRDIEEAKVFDILPRASSNYAKEMSQNLSISVKPVRTSEEAIKEADIICTASTSKVPVLDGDWLNDGAHINAIGAFTPETRELDTKTVKKSKIIVDCREAALAEAGDIIIPMKSGEIDEKHIYADLGEIVTKKKEGRVTLEEITVFKSVGLAIQDAAAASVVYSNALKEKKGVEIKLT
ncbi:MAG: ornithine cyclodeaminase family protein [Candidatus Hodarchaeota archaeon]